MIGIASDPSYLRLVEGVAGTPHERVHNVFNNEVLIGLHFAFGAPAYRPTAQEAAPQSVPAPVAARTYVVFFDWDRAALIDRACQIIGQAAQASTHGQTTRIEVNGYTDLSGTITYNKALSVRRAEAVAAELVRDRVNRAAISVEGFGESHPLVPTAQGVREPQNRRVEIVFG